MISQDFKSYLGTFMKFDTKSSIKLKKDDINKCDICDKMFEKPIQVKKHKAKNHKEVIANDFQVIDFNQHLNTYNVTDKPQQCNRCTRIAVIECKNQECAQLLRKYLCEFCDRNIHRGISTSDHERLFNSQNQITKSTEEKEEENLYCDHCNQYFKSHQELKIHIAEVVRKIS